MNFEIAKSKVIIHLLKGPIYRETSPSGWHDLLASEEVIAEYFSHMGLSLFVHRDFGFAFLKQVSFSDETPEDQILPRLIQQRELSFELSVLLALLRKKMIEHDNESGDPRLVLDEREIYAWMRVFLRDTQNEVKQKKDIDTLLQKAIDLGVLRRMTHDTRKLEILRVLAALFDAARLEELNQRLKDYEDYARPT